MNAFQAGNGVLAAFLERIACLHERYRQGHLHVRLPDALSEHDGPLEEIVSTCLPTSNAALDAASKSLFFSLRSRSIRESIGPDLATIDRDATGEPYRFLDMGALIATQGFGEKDPRSCGGPARLLRLRRYAHLRVPDRGVAGMMRSSTHRRLEPRDTSSSNRGRSGGERDQVGAAQSREDRGGARRRFIVSYEGVPRRTLGSLAVRIAEGALGFPTFDCPTCRSRGGCRRAREARREERSLSSCGTCWYRTPAARRENKENSARTGCHRRLPQRAGRGSRRVRSGAARAADCHVVRRSRASPPC